MCMINLLKDYIYPLLLKIHMANSSLGDIINPDKILKDIQSESNLIKTNVDLFKSIYLNYFTENIAERVKDLGKTVSLTDKRVVKTEVEEDYLILRNN